jgi:lipid-binding SYLF domain-containing protein
MRLFAIALLASTTLFATKVRNPTTRRLHEAGTVLSEIMSAPDKGIPHELIEKAQCVVVVPGLKKAAFVVGGQFGKGFITCRKGHTGWSAPAALRIEGGSFGLQIGGAEIDVVLLIMNERGAERLLSSKFTLGGEGEVAAGPVGRSATAQTDAKMTAEILSWSRSRGIFAGISLSGATLRQDLDDNASLYGKKLENQEIVRGNVPPPKSASRLLKLLNQYPATS